MSQGHAPQAQWTTPVNLGSSTGGVPVTVTITPNPANVSLGVAYELKATVMDALGNALPEVELVWGSSNPNAMIVQDGWVYCDTPGSYTVRATAANGVTGQVAVLV